MHIKKLSFVILVGVFYSKASFAESYAITQCVTTREERATSEYLDRIVDEESRRSEGTAMAEAFKRMPPARPGDELKCIVVNRHGESASAWVPYTVIASLMDKQKSKIHVNEETVFKFGEYEFDVCRWCRNYLEGYTFKLDSPVGLNPDSALLMHVREQKTGQKYIPPKEQEFLNEVVKAFSEGKCLDYHSDLRFRVDDKTLFKYSSNFLERPEDVIRKIKEKNKDVRSVEDRYGKTYEIIRGSRKIQISFGGNPSVNRFLNCREQKDKSASPVGADSVFKGVTE